MMARMNHEGAKVEVWDGEKCAWRDATPEELVPALVMLVAELFGKLRKLSE